ncbi:MAG TPA: coproporphyrinogen-III oxidase family protein [Candidatus Limnocylindrales bacterium]|nr:coproporphyrinogen-III oxidase family protein [Candidatus Limnocylindrales bacterium]
MPAYPPVGLYVHVPFCVALCPYCDFVVYPGASARGPRSRVPAFLPALDAELRLRADACDAAFGRPGEGDRPHLRSLYLGGGTPSMLAAEAIARVIGTVRDRFGLADDAEVTIEANPGPDERGDAAALVAAGVTRYSVGAQSLDPALLRRLGRRHRPDDVVVAIERARAAGMRSISVDLLYDVPGQSLGAFLDSLDGVLAVGPDHVSLYALTLDDPEAEGLTGGAGDHLPTSPGARRWRQAARTEQDEDRAAAQYHAASALLAESGYRGYEISNWARPGHESRHNLAYWQRQPVEAVGPGAHAFDGRTRRWNAAPLDGYLSALTPAVGPPSLPPGGAETLSAEAERAEALVLGLRLDTGLAVETANRDGRLGKELGPLLAAGLLEITGRADGEHVRLTTAGRLLSNEVFARLL